MNENDFKTEKEITWCPGCQGYGVLAALKKAFVQNNLEPKDIVVTYDIGCSSNMINFLNVCGFATLHGRSIPVAVGVKIANPKLIVTAQGGEGGMITEGANHLVHAAQRNDPILAILNNNFVFGLTAGQASSATPKGVKTKSTPEGNPHEALSGIDLAAISGATFLARTLASDITRTTEIFSQAIKHKGFALVEIIQPCVIWTKELKIPGANWVEKPFKDINDLIGKNNLFGVLYKKN